MTDREVVGRHQCPSCGKWLDAMARMNGPEDPHPGGVSVCAYCAAVCIITEAMTLRRPTPMELLELSRDPAVVRTIVIVTGIIMQRQRESIAERRRAAENN